MNYDFILFEETIIDKEDITPEVIESLEDWCIVSVEENAFSCTRENNKRYINLYKSKKDDAFLILFHLKLKNYLKDPNNIDRLFSIDDKDICYEVLGEEIRNQEPHNVSFCKFKDVRIRKDLEYNGVILNTVDLDASSILFFINCIKYFKLSYKDFDIIDDFSDNANKVISIWNNMMNFLRMDFDLENKEI